MTAINEIALKYGVRYGENISINEILATDLRCLQWAGADLDWLEALLAPTITNSEADLYKHIFNSITQCRDAVGHNRDGVLYDVSGNTLKVFKVDLRTRMQQLFRLN